MSFGTDTSEKSEYLRGRNEAIERFSRDELVHVLSNYVGVRVHTSVEGTYCRVFVGECNSGKILTWQTEHGNAKVLVIKE